MELKGCVLWMLAVLPWSSVGAEELTQPTAPANTSESTWVASSQEEFDQRFKGALKRHDAPAMALLVKFPLRVNFADLSSISVDDPPALAARFDEIFPPWWRERVLHSEGSDHWLIDQGKFGIEHGLAWGRFLGGEDQPRLRLFLINVIPEGKDSLATLHFACESATQNVLIEYRRGQDHFSANLSAWKKPNFPPAPPDTFAEGSWDFGNATVKECVGYKWHFQSAAAVFDVRERACPDLAETGVPDGAKAEIVTTESGRESRREFCF